MKITKNTKRIGHSFGAAALALLLQPAAAIAQRQPQPQLPPQLPQQQCPQPSPQECMDPAWAETECGRQEKELAALDPDEVCNVYVREQLEQYINQSYNQGAPYRQDYTVVPDGMFGAGEVQATLIESDRWAQSVDYFGFRSTYADHLMRQKVAALNPQSWAATELMDYMTPWRNNGTTVESCAEYVYEKWFEYSRFQDDAAALKSDYRGIYERARRFPDGLAWGPIHSMDGTAQREVEWPSGMIPKNAYFLFQPTSYDVYPFDPSTIPSAAGEEYWNVDWGYHGMLSGAMAMDGKTDAEMYAMDGRQEKFKKLLAKRAKLIAKLEKEDTGKFSFLSESPLAFASPVSEDFVTKKDFYSIKDASEFGTFTGGGTVVETPIKFTGGYTGTMGDLYAVDHVISSMLIEARDKGCLNLYDETVCDWSPQQFVRFLGKQFVSQTESDFNRCVAATGDDFSPASIIRTAITSGISGASMQDYTGSSTDVTRFLELYESYVINKDFTPAPGSVTDGATGWWKTGAGSAGSPDTLEGSYNWALGFGARKGSTSSTPDCSADLAAMLQFNAGVTLFSMPYNVVDFLTTVESRGDKLHAHSHLTVAGTAIYKPIDSDVGLTWTILDLADTKSLTASGNAMIGPFPVTYELGLVGEGSLKVGFAATLGRACSGGGGTVNLLLDGNAIAKVSGGVMAAGGVGVTWASAGLKGKLNLVDVSFEPKARMRIYNETPGDLGSLVGDFTFDLPRSFSTLSGTLSFYAKLASWLNYEKVLAKWDGLTTSTNDAPPRPIHIPLHKVWSKL